MATELWVWMRRARRGKKYAWGPWVPCDDRECGTGYATKLLCMMRPPDEDAINTAQREYAVKRFVMEEEDEEEYPKLVCLLQFPSYTILVNGRRYMFEMPPSCGLSPMNADYTGRKTDWPKAVWDAVQAWSDQGQKVDPDGLCAWTA